jgi:hypothetical protein
MTPWVKRLLIANVVVFLVTMVNQEFFFRWFAFAPLEVMTRPWGVVTYMFLHGDLMHLAVNMLVLFFFGPPLEARWGSMDFIKFYLICGLGGVALSFLLASSAWIVGASAAIYGLMLAFAMNWPQSQVARWLPVCREPHECLWGRGREHRPFRPPRRDHHWFLLPQEWLAAGRSEECEAEWHTGPAHGHRSPGRLSQKGFSGGSLSGELDGSGRGNARRSRSDPGQNLGRGNDRAHKR